MRRWLPLVVGSTWLPLTAGCEFPQAFECQVNTDCRNGAVCDEISARCVAPSLPGDASVPDSGLDASVLSPEIAALCAALCPRPGPCDARLPLENGSFEDDDSAWTFATPARRTRSTTDGAGTASGQWMGELRLDWAEASEIDTASIEQKRPGVVYPPGPYRLCFDWRLSSRLKNCYAEEGPSQRATLTDAASDDGQAVWWLDSATWCEDATESGIWWTVEWSEACAEFQRDEPWTSPGVRFEASRTGPWEFSMAHSLAIDDVRLQAISCLSFR